MKSRKCIISSLSDWDELHVSHSFVPKYKGGKAPNDPNAEIFTLDVRGPSMMDLEVFLYQFYQLKM